MAAATQANLGKIRSGRISLRLEVRPRGGLGPIGVRLEGPFALESRGSLPLARIAYTQLAGQARGGATLISTGRRAYVEVERTAYRLGPARERQLRAGIAEVKGRRGLRGLGLHVADWLDDPKIRDGPQLGGEDTERISGRLDVVATLNDLLRAAKKAGGAGRLKIDERSARRLREAVDSSSIELLTGADDRLLRELDLRMGFDAPKDLRRLLGVRGGDLRLSLRIAKPNARVVVRAPRAAQPLSALGAR